MVQIVGVLPLHCHGRAHEGRVLRRLFPQKRGQAAALVVFDQLAGEFLLHPLARFTAGQQQTAFHLHQMRRHLDEGTCPLRVGLLVLLHRAGVLVDQLQDGDVVQIHLMFGHKRQQ